jgi:hypothetical protein
MRQTGILALVLCLGFLAGCNLRNSRDECAGVNDEKYRPCRYR